MDSDRDNLDRATPVNELDTDVFPTTAYSLLGRWLREGDAQGLAQARTHVMDVYRKPLAVYFAGSSFARTLKRHSDDTDDLVRGFFADRLSRQVFLQDWLRSKRPLRFWLIVAFKHYLWEETERRQREQRDGQPRKDRRPKRAESDHDPERRFHRDIAITLVREAAQRTIEALASDGHATEWHTVIRHHLEGVGYRELAEELGVSPTQAKVMTMRAVAGFRRNVEQLVGWPGATAEQVRQEIENLMEAIRT